MCFYSIDYKAIPENIGLLFPNRLAKIDSNSPPPTEIILNMFLITEMCPFLEKMYTHTVYLSYNVRFQESSQTIRIPISHVSENAMEKS